MVINGRAVRAVTLNGLMMAANRRPEVSFGPIFDCIDDSKWCLKEGEEVLKAGYIVACGIKEEKAGHIVVHALSVQTSDIRGKPHQLEASVKKDEFTAVT